MNEIKCKVEGCTEVFRTEEPVSLKARFICKNHPKEVQIRAVGRKYNPKTDEADEEVHFQNHQFDKDLNRKAKRDGLTNHIPIPAERIAINSEEEDALARIKNKIVAVCECGYKWYQNELCSGPCPNCTSLN